MRLPRLKILDGQELKLSSCQGLEGCKSCELYTKNGGRCEGCTPHKRETLKENYVSCYKECHECTGYEVQVTSICCRSPLKDMYMNAVAGKDWNNPTWKLTERPIIDAARAVFYVTAGSISTILNADGYLVPPGTKTVAVSLGRVMGAKRFASSDMYDYLKIPTKTELILLTVNKDDILERAWDNELYDPDVYTKVGFKYWMPICFSAYHTEAKMQQYYQFLRTMYVSERSKAWFTCGDFYRAGLDIADLYDKAIEAMPQVFFNAQFLVNNELLRRKLMIVTWFHKRYSVDIPFWFVGTCTPTLLHNLRKIVGKKRPLHFVSGNPHHHATQGKELLLSGKSRKSALPKSDLVAINLTTLERMVSQYG